MAEEASCKSCGQSLLGRYCHACGEKVLDEEDKRFKSIVSEFFSAVTFTDSTFWKTLRTMVVAPGLFSRDFVDGRRKPYMRPLSVFLLANLIYFLFPLMLTFHTSLRAQTSEPTLLHRDVAKAMVEKRIERRGVSFEEYEATYEAKTKELSKLMLIAVVVLISIPLWLIHGPRRVFYSESFVLSLELVAFFIIFGLQGQGLVMLAIGALGYQAIVTEALVTSVAVALLLYFLLRAELFFFRSQGGQKLIRAALGIVGLVVAVFLYRMLLFFVTFWVT